MENMSFEVKLTRNDLFVFNMYHTYTHSTGWVSIILGLFAIGFGIYSLKDGSSLLYNAIYIGAGFLLLAYIPVTLFIRAGAGVKPGSALGKTITYTITDYALLIKMGESEAEMPWNSVYKLKNKSKRMFIYTSRINAFIIPKECIDKNIEATLISHCKAAEETL